jgi:hypothetical protein
MMRLDELLLAKDVLKDRLNFEERLCAAYALENNVRMILEFLDTIPADKIEFDPLKKEELRAEVNEMLAKGRENGKDVMEKSILFRRGSHWWLRARYGSGPLNGGLLKAPEAVASPDAMVGLYMPKSPNKPINNYWSSDDYAPGYERRHHYNWAVERRDRLHIYASTTVPVNGPWSFTGDSFW